MIEKARHYAIAAHGEQKYGDKPYIHHLEAVVKILEPYGDEAKLIGYLHDVAEDTLISIKDIETEFGQFVAACVAILSDEPGANRKERKSKTYEKMLKVTGKEELALVVKAADRLANIEACISDKNMRHLVKQCIVKDCVMIFGKELINQLSHNKPLPPTLKSGVAEY